MQIPERWVIAELFAIREKGTDKYLPLSKLGRGGSSLEPTPVSKAQPRLFKSERAAKSALGHWLRGELQCTRYEDGGEVHKLIPKPHRIREKMEIIRVVLTPKELT